MLRVIENTIRSMAVISSDGLYRYRLTKIWDEDKPCIAFILLNPSTADNLRTDITAMNICNYSIANDYGRIDIVNLFAFRATNSKDMPYWREAIGEYNDQYILDAVLGASKVIIGWGSDQKVYNERKMEVHNLLREYKSKLMCFKDEEGRRPRNPVKWNKIWALVDYNLI